MLVIIVVVLVVTGLLGYHTHQLYTGAEKIEVLRATVKTLQLQGFPIPSKIILEIELQLDNPSPVTLEIERLNCRILFNNVLIGEGVREKIKLPGNTSVNTTILIETEISDIVENILVQILQGKKNITVTLEGSMEIPVKPLGIEVTSRTRTFNITETYSLPGVPGF